MNDKQSNAMTRDDALATLTLWYGVSDPWRSRDEPERYFWQHAAKAFNRAASAALADSSQNRSSADHFERLAQAAATMAALAPDPADVGAIPDAAEKAARGEG